MATLSELEARLTALEHINAIKEVQARYWLSVDRQRLDEVRDCFVETGAVIDMEGIQPGIFSFLTDMLLAFASTFSTVPLKTNSFLPALSFCWPYATNTQSDKIVAISITYQPNCLLFIPFPPDQIL